MWSSKSQWIHLQIPWRGGLRRYIHPYLGFGGMQLMGQTLLSTSLGHGCDQVMGLENQLDLGAGASAESPGAGKHGLKQAALLALFLSLLYHVDTMVWLSKVERSKVLEKLSCIHLMSSPGSAACVPTPLSLSIPAPKGPE